MSISTQKASHSDLTLDEKCESTQNETILPSGEKPARLKHDPKIDPQIICQWNGTRWDILDNDKLVNPRQRNILIQRLRIFLNRQFRVSRVKARAAQKVNNEVTR